MKTILAIVLLIAMLAMPAVLADPGGKPNDNAIWVNPLDTTESGWRSPVGSLTYYYPGTHGDLPYPGMAVDDLIQYGLQNGFPVDIVALVLSDGDFNANCQPPEVIPGEPPVF